MARGKRGPATRKRRVSSIKGDVFKPGFRWCPLCEVWIQYPCTIPEMHMGACGTKLTLKPPDEGACFYCGQTGCEHQEAARAHMEMLQGEVE